MLRSEHLPHAAPYQSSRMALFAMPVRSVWASPSSPPSDRMPSTTGLSRSEQARHVCAGDWRRSGVWNDDGNTLRQMCKRQSFQTPVSGLWRRTRNGHQICHQLPEVVAMNGLLLPRIMAALAIEPIPTHPEDRQNGWVPLCQPRLQQIAKYQIVRPQ
jgi:hypothetical protein